MKNNNRKDKKYTELIWAEKYKDFICPKKKTEIERVALQKTCQKASNFNRGDE